MVLQSLSRVWLRPRVHQPFLSFIISQSLLKLMSVGQWCYLTVSSSVTLFSSCLQSFPESGSFPVSRFFTSGDQSIGTSASVLPINIQGWFPLGLTGLILQSKGLSRVFFHTTVQKHQFFGAQLSLSSNFTSVHDYWKNQSFDLCWQSNISAFK